MSEPRDQPTPAEIDALTEHMVETYHSLRKWMGLIAFFFPVFFLLWTWIVCRRWTPGPSISGYYYSHDAYVRDVFVGVLCIEGVCLALYRGYSKTEHWLFNLAGLFAVGIALFPTDASQAPCRHLAGLESPVAAASAEDAGERSSSGTALPVPLVRKFSVHGFCAIGFFATIALAVLLQARASLPEMKDEAKRKWYARIYRIYSAALVVVPLATWALLALSGAGYLVFGIEFVAIWIFAFYWRTKSREFMESPGQPELQLVKRRCGVETKCETQPPE